MSQQEPTAGTKSIFRCKRSSFLRLLLPGAIQRNTPQAHCSAFVLVGVLLQRGVKRMHRRWLAPVAILATLSLLLQAVLVAAAALPEKLRVSPMQRLKGKVFLPGSKSLSNRVLLLAAMSQGSTVVRNLLDADDVRHMLGALKELQVDGVSMPCCDSVVKSLCAAMRRRSKQVEVDFDPDAKVARVKGNNGPFRVQEARLNLGNAGTAMRPLVAAVAAGQGRYLLDGTPRMRERPIADLVQALQQVTCLVVHVRHTVYAARRADLFVRSLVLTSAADRTAARPCG